MDDFSKFTWILFLSHKNEVFQDFSKFCKKVHNDFLFFIFTITYIKSDQKREFENVKFKTFCNEHRIDHNFQLLELFNKMG